MLSLCEKKNISRFSCLQCLPLKVTETNCLKKMLLLPCHISQMKYTLSYKQHFYRQHQAEVGKKLSKNVRYLKIFRFLHPRYRLKTIGHIIFLLTAIWLSHYQVWSILERTVFFFYSLFNVDIQYTSPMLITAFSKISN